MKNPVFNLITRQKDDFNKTFTIEEKTAQSETHYLLIKPRQAGQSKFYLDKQQYTVIAWHISVYNDLRRDEGKGQASYHLTLEIVDRQQKASSMRIYFNSFNKLLYANHKNTNQVITPVGNVVSVSQLAKAHIKSFYNQFWNIYIHLHDTFESKYVDLMCKLEDTSKLLQSFQNLEEEQHVWATYSNQLEVVLKYLEDWYMFELNPDISTFNFLQRLSEHVLEKLKGIEAQKQMVVPTELGDLLSLRQLEKDMRKKFAYLLSLDTLYKQVSMGELEDLVKKISFISINDFIMAVKNNRHHALKLLIQHHQYINLDQPISSQNITLLEYAHKVKSNECFYLLLEAGVACDNPDKEGKTLLIDACLNRRKDEMLALLRAGASNYIRARGGYTAFGLLSMSDSKEPDLTLMQLFIDNCVNFDIDLMQGPDHRRGTPLIYACQHRRLDVVQLLLRNKANPTFGRETDNLTALAVSAAKGFPEICKAILKLSHYPLNDNCAYALQIAQKSSHNSKVLKLLKQYMQQHNISEEVVQAVNFGVGTSMSVIEDFLGIKPKDDLVDLTALLANMFLSNNITASPQTTSSLKSSKEKDAKKPTKRLGN